MLTLDQFDYQLPQEQIAQSPTNPRDHSKLMLINRTNNSITHHYFYDLPRLIPKGYQVIANNTKVFPARILATKSTGGKIELLLLSRVSNSSYTAIAKPGLKLGATCKISDSLTAIVTKISGYTRTLEFSLSDPQLTHILAKLGTMPTPPYIKKILGNQQDYQTIYAKHGLPSQAGFSAAAPTAGLHFTPELLTSIKQDHSWHELTLNVGLGTFLPVKENDITKHPMHKETYSMTPEFCKTVQEERTKGHKILAIGTTTTRALESSPTLIPGTRSTEIFLYPPYQFQHTDALLTNFHLPKSTLLMLVSALTSFPNTNSHFTTFADSLIGRAYHQAIINAYRFFSFGDAMLII